MTPPNKKQAAAMELYCQLLDESNARLICIERGLNGQFNLPGPFLRELCFIQLRMLCELIALACLAAHGDIGTAPVSKQLKKEWHPNRIMTALETLHSEFYPIPCMQEKRGPGIFHLTAREQTFSKDDLFALHKKSGEALHKGSVKKLLRANPPIQTNYPEVLAWAQKIAGLLAIHQIALFGSQRLVCYLKPADNGGHAKVALATPVAHPDPIPDS